MPSRSNPLGLVAVVLALVLPAVAAEPPAWTFHIEAGASPAWSDVLSAIGLTAVSDGQADVVVRRTGAQEAMAPRFLVLEGDSPAARAIGFVPTEKNLTVRSVRDRRRADLSIVWERARDLPAYSVPPTATVFAEERWTGAPLMAGLRLGERTVLWLADSLGEKGYERFPYALHALADLGLTPPFRSRRLWLFLDGAYRSRVDLDYMARRWREAGASAIHVAAWHHFESHPDGDAWLKRLIEACHRNALQVYAWLELPHVSEQFWEDHPEWREKTAILQDAQLDWRKLMNLANPECACAISTGLSRLLGRFDWDGVNLAELYFESLEGHANPARFTPLNDDVRTEFRALHGFDPLELFQGEPSSDSPRLRAFLDYRSVLARRLQEQWIREVERERRVKPDLDLVLTQVDDRHDTDMRDRIGADSSLTLPLLEQHDFTFLVEDPATVWSEGPERYVEIAGKYQPLTPRPERLAIDINVVERYQDVYPTKQQTGAEMLLQVHLAATAFPRVALYAEHSLLRPDLPLLSAAAATAEGVEFRNGRPIVSSRRGIGVRWNGPALVDGKPWPVAGGGAVWLPPGSHTVEPGEILPAPQIVDFTGELLGAEARSEGVEVAYRSSTRAFAVLAERPATVLIDDVNVPVRGWVGEKGYVVPLPRGEHLVLISARNADSQ